MAHEHCLKQKIDRKLSVSFEQNEEIDNDDDGQNLTKRSILKRRPTSGDLLIKTSAKLCESPSKPPRVVIGQYSNQSIVDDDHIDNRPTSANDDDPHQIKYLSPSPSPFTSPGQTPTGTPRSSVITGGESDLRRRPSMIDRIGSLRRSSMAVAKATAFEYRGLVYAALSSVFFTLTATIAKLLTTTHHGQVALVRYVGIFLFAMPMLAQSGVSTPFGPKNRRIYLTLRGVSGATSLYLRYAALKVMPIANTTIVIMSTPVFVSIFARVFLKEPCGIFHLVSIGVTLVGIFFSSNMDVIMGLFMDDVVDIDDHGHQVVSLAVELEREQWMFGFIYSMAATSIGAATYIFLRKVKDVHESVIMANFSVYAMVEVVALTALSGVDHFQLPKCEWEPWLLGAVGVLSFYAQLLLTRALQIEEASIVSVTRCSTDVVCAFVFQTVFFGHVPEWNVFLGALFVAVAVLLTAARKWVVTLPGNHWAQRWLLFTTR